MGTEQDASFYNENLDRHVAEVWESEWLPLYAVAASRIAPDDAVADIGCGTGRLAKLLQLRGHRTYWGVDFASARIEEASAYVPEYEFTVADVLDPETTPAYAKFDAFVVLELLEHLEDDLRLVRAFPPGSRVVASVPTYDAAAHVRWFPTVDDAIARYSRLLEIEPSQVAVLPHGRKGRQVFVFEGTRREDS